MELRRVRFRLDVSGSHYETAFYDPAEVPDIGAWLTERLGPLAAAPETEDAPLQTPIRKDHKGAVMERPRPSFEPVWFNQSLRAERQTSINGQLKADCAVLQTADLATTPRAAALLQTPPDLSARGFGI